MTEKVYGLPIQFGGEYDADSLFEASREEKQRLVDEHKDEVETYTIESWYYYLNSDQIDTENYYWFIL